MKTKHIGQSVAVANGAGRVKCWCGWQSKVQDDGYMFMAEDQLPAHFTANAWRDFHLHVAEELLLNGSSDIENPGVLSGNYPR